MSLILAIEPDPRQSRELRELVRRRLSADLVHAPTTEGALAALAGVGDRVPDLVLVPSLLSPQEDAAIAGALRVIAAAANVRMLTIPLLARAEEPKQPGMLARLRGKKPKVTAAGCDPDVFAEQIAAYLEEAAAERKAIREELEEAGALPSFAAPPAAPDTAAAPDAPAALPDPLPQQTYKPLIIQPVIATASQEAPTAAPPRVDFWPHRSAEAIRETAAVAPEPLAAAHETPVVSAVGESLVLPSPASEAAVEPASEPISEPVVIAPAAEVIVALEPLVPVAEAVVASEPVALVAEPSIDPVIEAVAAAVAQPIPEPKPLAADEVKARFFASRIRIPKAVAKPVPPPPAVEPPMEAVAQAEPVAPAPVVVAEAPSAPAPAPVAEPVVAAAPAVAPQLDEPKHRASRSRIRIPRPSVMRKAAAKPKPQPRDDREEIDVDALIAPLLTQMATERKPAPPREQAPASLAANPAAAARQDTAVSAAAPPAASVHVATPASYGGSPPEEVDPMFFADDAMTTPPPTPAQAERSAWLELVESLRQDIERLKAEKTEAAAPPPPPPPPVEQKPQTVVAKAVSAIRRRPPADVVNMPAPETRTSRVKPRKPVQDQWGLFDPEQCGFAALLAKLDEIGSRDEISA